jgi:hypothetical protein
LIGIVGGAAWQLKNEWAEVKIATGSTGYVQGGSSRDKKGSGNDGHVGLRGEHFDSGTKVRLSTIWFDEIDTVLSRRRHQPLYTYCTCSNGLSLYN